MRGSVNPSPSGHALLGHACAWLRPWVGLLAVCAVFSLHSGFRSLFWTLDYLPNLLQQSATNIVLAVGMTFVIITGGIDLSVGSVLALCGIALGTTLRGGVSLPIAVLIALPVAVVALMPLSRRIESPYTRAPVSAAVLAVLAGGLGYALYRGSMGGLRLEWAILLAVALGASLGLVNGLGVTLGRTPPFVVSLGMMVAARGLTVYTTNGNSVSGLGERLRALGENGPVVAVALVTAVIGWVILTRTAAGRQMTAIGGNEEATRLSGVDITLYKTFAYVLCGITAGLAAVILTAKFGVADTGAGTGYELYAIAAVVVGGTSLSGGRGTVAGTVAGALTIAVLEAGLVLMGAPDTLQRIIIGAVIVATVMLDRSRRSR